MRAASMVAIAALAGTLCRAQVLAEPTSRGGARFSQWNVSGRLDFQLLRTDASGAHPMAETKGVLMGAEIETMATVSDGVRDVLDLAVQWPYATGMSGPEGRGRQMHFGNAYAVVKLGLGRPNIRVGQFVVPFGNLTSYETHTRPLQTLYAHSLGVRIDRGVSVEGMSGAYDWWLALVGGNGPRGDNDGRPAFVARAARRLILPSGARVSIGFSAMSGSSMPRFATGIDPTMEHGDMGMSAHDLVHFTDKTRLGFDAEVEMGQDVWRAEMVTGRDSDGGVNGQFVQWNRALTAGSEITAQIARWHQPAGTRLALGASIGRQVDRDTMVRLSAIQARGRVGADRRRETMVVLQVAREVPRLFR